MRGVSVGLMMKFSRRVFLKMLASGALGAAGLDMCGLPASAALFRKTHKWRKYEMTANPAELWLKQYEGKISENELKLLQRAQDTFAANVLKAADPAKALPWSPHRGIAPSSFNYRGVWNWDSAFHAMAAARWDAELARDQVRIALKNQLPSGALVDVVFEDGRVVTNFGKPPVMPWACAIVDRHAPDDGFLREAYDKFILYEAHWRKDRGGDRDGLFYYDSSNEDEPQRYKEAKLESGWDTSVRWDSASYKLWAVDLNCFMLMLYRAMAYMADRLHLPDDVKKWEDRRKVLAEKINQKLWNPAAGAYMDYNFTTNQFTGVLSPASFHPLYCRIASSEQAAQSAKLAADPDRFFPGMPSVSYNDPQYESSNYWRGPMWLNITYFAVKGFAYYGHDRLANDFRRTVLDWCSKNEDYLYEYYDSKSGKGLGARQYGWTATFVIEFILNWNKADDL